MNLSRKLVTLVFLLAFFWTNFVLAETKDVLLVSVKYDSSKSQAFKISGIEQRVLDDSNFVVSQEGAYKLVIANSNTEFSSNGFDTLQNNFVELIGDNGYQEGESIARSQYLSVILPITKDVSVDSIVKIVDNKTKSTILENKISEIPTVVSQAKKSTILAQDNNSDFPPFEDDTGLNLGDKTPSILWTIIGIALIILIGWGIWFVRRSRKANIPPPPAP